MKLSEAGAAFIKGMELLRLTAYPDGKSKDGEQLYSIGYGHNGVNKGDVITRQQAEDLFTGDVRRIEAAIHSVVPRASQQEFDAFVAFAYNIGPAGFKGSTVVKRHNAGDRQGAADAFRMWNKSDGGKLNPVLVRRRERERQVYLVGDYGPARTLSVAPQPAMARSLGTNAAAGLFVAGAAALAAYLLLPRMAATRRLFALGA